VSAPHILLVDDSEAVLAYEKAALSGDYLLTTATTGVEALEKIRALSPSLVLLDLSMPELDGEDVLQRCQADPELARIPFIVVSAEHERAERCMGLGASAVLHKPIRAEALIATVARILERAAARDREDGLGVLPVMVGGVRLGLPVSSVRAVLPQMAARPVLVGPFYLTGIIEYESEPVCVLDLAARLGVEHHEPLVEQKLVLVSVHDQTLALAVDRVRDPEEYARSSSLEPGRLGIANHPPLDAILVAVIGTPEGPLPVIEPAALLSARTFRDLARKLVDAS
jgi:CheY-like chemotaxis protein/chemotaxis signal transduction protein